MKNKYFNSIIVCAFNEEENISHCLLSIQKALKEISEYEVLVINNGSSDNTDTRIKNFCDNPSNTITDKLKVFNMILIIRKN